MRQMPTAPFAPGTVLILRPLTAGQFPEFRDMIVASYAADNVASGRWRETDALALSLRETEKALHAGAETPGQLLFAMTVRGIAEAIGYLWATAFEQGGLKVVFVCQVIVKPEYRRRGYARSALLNLEQLAADTDHDAMVLTVFGSNEGAQALYRSLGYRASTITLQKDLRSFNTKP